VWAGALPVVVAPKFRSFSSPIFSQMSQSVTVKVRVDRIVRRNKFMVNNSLHVEKKLVFSLLNSEPATPILLWVTVRSSIATIVAVILDHNRKSNFRHPL
jgi:ABC-type cobalamin transport system permease subunit